MRNMLASAKSPVMKSGDLAGHSIDKSNVNICLSLFGLSASIPGDPMLDIYPCLPTGRV